MQPSRWPSVAGPATGARQTASPCSGKPWLAVIEQVGAKSLVMGGKSMAGRIARLVADEAGIAGLVCLVVPRQPHLGRSERR